MLPVGAFRALLLAGAITLQGMVSQVASYNGIDPDVAMSVVQVESAWNPQAIGDNGLSVGLWQFRGADSSNTWSWLCKVTGYPEWGDDSNRSDPVLTTIVATKAISMGYGDHWSGWRLVVYGRP